MWTLRRHPMVLGLSVLVLSAPSFAAVNPASSVLDAVAERDVAALRALLKSGADVNAAKGDGLTAIHQVAIDGDREMAKLLIYAGANLKATTRLGGYTPLLLAARDGDAGMIETLLAGGADPNQATTNGTSPLMFAAASGNVEAVKALFEKGADLKAVEKSRGENALMFAAARGRVEVVKYLLAHGADLKSATKVVDVNVFTREAQAAFAAAAGAAPPASKPGDDAGNAGAPVVAGSGGAPAAKPAEAGVPSGANDDEDAEAEAPKPPANAPTAGGSTGVGAEKSPTAAAEASPSQESGKGKDKSKDKKQAKSEAKSLSAAMKDAPPKMALNPPPAAPPAEAKAATPDPAAPKTAEAAKPKKPQVPGVDRNFAYNELVGFTGGFAPLHFAVRQGNLEVVKALLEGGADINQVTDGDKTSPLLMAVINGQFDLAMYLLDHGADPKLASENGATPLYAAVNVQWAPKALYPQPRAYLQQKTTHLELMKALLDHGAPVDARLTKKVWYSGYNFDLSGVDETGATAFWRAAYASDVDAMKLLVAHGADPTIRTKKSPGRPPTGDARRDTKDVSGLPPVPTGGPAVTALQAAAGAGYGEGFAANSHRFAPGGMLAAVKYLVDELHADVNVPDHEGNTALHHAAARGDNEMIKFLVSRGANVMVVNREGKTTVDMANAPVQRVEPFPETIALLESMGAKNNHRCVSCDLATTKKTDARK